MVDEAEEFAKLDDREQPVDQLLDPDGDQVKKGKGVNRSALREFARRARRAMDPEEDSGNLSEKERKSHLFNSVVEHLYELTDPAGDTYADLSGCPQARRQLDQVLDYETERSMESRREVY